MSYRVACASIFFALKLSEPAVWLLRGNTPLYRCLNVSVFVSEKKLSGAQSLESVELLCCLSFNMTVLCYCFARNNSDWVNKLFIATSYIFCRRINRTMSSSRPILSSPSLNRIALFLSRMNKLHSLILGLPRYEMRCKAGSVYLVLSKCLGSLLKICFIR